MDDSQKVQNPQDENNTPVVAPLEEETAKPETEGAAEASEEAAPTEEVKA